MDHLIQINVKILPWTNTKPTRLKLSLPRWKNKSFVISVNEDIKEQIKLLFASYDIKIHGFTSSNKIDCILIDFKEVNSLLKMFKIE